MAYRATPRHGLVFFFSPPIKPCQTAPFLPFFHRAGLPRSADFLPNSFPHPDADLTSPFFCDFVHSSGSGKPFPSPSSANFHSGPGSRARSQGNADLPLNQRGSPFPSRTNLGHFIFSESGSPFPGRTPLPPPPPRDRTDSASPVSCAAITWSLRALPPSPTNFTTTRCWLASACFLSHAVPIRHALSFFSYPPPSRRSV